ncbi:MAG TPA: phosphate signaling complex protein PhoU [Candidatus Krumholzibacteria bacterium]|nr:phosphate signaling complex protein PhoU [Candidatus Krumholzibacteria bacterium]HPD70481.1 phosphate signaling complex protein PhoU [Candidatus Krumholzibacteria bacterium]HRY39819.1 phosphate signaling complex protein PhoU [Candidatus Krumholzibacteria bacterium]
MHPHLAPEFRRLKASLFSLSAAVEQNVHLAVKAVLDGDASLVERIRARDQEIDLMEVEFEEDCLKVLALYQPVAVDLRFVVAVLKVNNDLERIGDLAVNIAEHAPTFAGKDPVDTARLLPTMAGNAQAMLRRSLDALVEMDPELAQTVLAADDEVDNDYHELAARARAEIRADGSRIDEMLPLMLVSKHIERIADLATNIAEDAIYMVRGEIVRHGRHHAAREE